MDKLRTVVKSHRFEQEMAALEPDVRRTDEFLEGAEWYLMRCPTIGTQLGNSHVWYLPSEELATMEPLVLYYTFDDERVLLLSVSRAKLGSDT